MIYVFFSSRRRHTRLQGDWSSDVCSSDLGHGRSPAIGEAFDMNDLADDAAGVIEALGQGPVHFVGLSMGGMTAQALAVRHPALVRSITIAKIGRASCRERV